MFSLSGRLIARPNIRFNILRGVTSTTTCYKGVQIDGKENHFVKKERQKLPDYINVAKKERLKSPVRTSKSIKALSELQPKSIEPENKKVYGDLGEEISGKKINKNDLLKKLAEFYELPSVRELARSHHIDGKLFYRAYISFRKYCYKSESLPPELYVTFCDIIDGHGHATDIFPFFLSHARQVFPHLECHEELRKISYLGLPHNWYPEARAKTRKIFFHSGPTNSGKTYSALKRFMNSKSGIYCGPLKLLAVEVYHKANDNNTPCDLVTGEERKYANKDGCTSSSHVSCTVEMAQINEPVEVAVIDEIQMIRDAGRGWAWTRALLGIPADEIHLCGEEAAVDAVSKILLSTGDSLEIVRYQRLTPLVIEEKPLLDLKNVRSGDCIVCFSKDHVYNLSMALEKLGHQVAVIYGTLPPGAKLSQCQKFNKLEECNVMVATDAIGMGLNLSIGRIIFHSLMKTTNDEKGNRSLEYLTTSHCLQIAGRAGRFNTTHSTGYVTTLRAEDLPQLREIMSQGVQPIERAGLHPTADQIELFAFHLPHLTLSNLIDLFIDLCEFDESAYFICDMENFKTLANTIQHMDIPLRARYVFCCAPISIKSPFTVAMFTKFVRQFSEAQPVTVQWLKRQISWPCKTPRNIEELSHLEVVFDVFELYLWLSYRFPDQFPDPDDIRALQVELDSTIYGGVSDIVRLLKAIKPLKQSLANK